MDLPGSFYFFLSYADVPPVPRLPVGGEQPAPRDLLVDTFFADLLGSVQRLARSGVHKIGVYDQSISPGTGWQDTLRALGQAEVFVPLYSPRYVASAWATEEHYSFEKRLEAAHADSSRHIQPVLWMPFPAGVDPAAYGLQSLDQDVQPYKELGLGALCDAGRLDQTPDPVFRKAYEKIVNRVARRIVDAAEQAPIGPSEPPREPRDATVTPATADFLIVPYQAPGSTPDGWAPYAAARHVPIAGQALGVAQRMDVVAAIATPQEAARMWRRKPAVLLLDVWLLDDEERAGEVAEILRGLPTWVLPLLIVDGDDRAHATRVGELRERALDMLGGSADVANSAEGFQKIMPVLVSQARSRYLHELPSTFPSRPRLGMAEPRRMPARGEDR
jgi:FxsC-like protein